MSRRIRMGARRRGVVIAATALCLAVAGAPSANGAATATLASWQMNESPGARTMLDSSGNHVDGAIGSGVIVGATYDGAKGYRWAFVSPTNPPAHPERLVLVEDARLNPGTRDFAVTIRYRTTQPFGNIIQKGQGGADGGYWKIENPSGILTCVFRGRDTDGSWLRKEVTSGVALNDGRWHVVRCERTSSALTLNVDGTYTRSSGGRTGSIANPRPLSIAGKSSCDNIKITCDYFTGDIDWITISTG